MQSHVFLAAPLLFADSEPAYLFALPLMFDITLTTPQNIYFFAALMPCYGLAGGCNFCVQSFCALSFFTWSNGLEGASGGFPKSFKGIWNPNLYVGAWVALEGAPKVSSFDALPVPPETSLSAPTSRALRAPSKPARAARSARSAKYAVPSGARPS